MKWARKASVVSIIILLIFIVGICLAIIYRMDTENTYKVVSDNFHQMLIDKQKRRIEEVVDIVYSQIEIEKARLEKDIDYYLQTFGNVFENIEIKDEIIREDFEEQLGLQQSCDQLQADMIIWDSKNNSVRYSSNRALEGIQMSQAELAKYTQGFAKHAIRYIQSKDTVIIFGLTKEAIEERAKELALNDIRNMGMGKDIYIWVSEILDYNGGTDYARCIVDHTMPEREGHLLSTYRIDKTGNFPYQKELEDIKRTGESWNTYHYKKKDSNDVALKISYTKLYKPYNWIISAGIHIDDITAYVEENSNYLAEGIKRQIDISFINILGVMLFSGTAGSIIWIYHMKKEKQLIEEREKISKAHYKLLEEKYNSGNTIIHDIKNHLICVHSLAKNASDDKVIEYIESMNVEIEKYRHTVITGNEILDVILSEKLGIMDQNRIECELDIEPIDLSFIKLKDQVSLLSNMLDNAIQHISHKEIKQIKFITYTFNESWMVLKLINTCDQQPKIREKRFLTRKLEKEGHGYGMQIIYKVTEYYGGNVKWSYNEEISEFSLMVMLPKPKC